MERYLLLAGGILALGAFLPALFFFVRATHQFFLMLGHLRSGRHNVVANLVPFVAVFLPQFFTEQGNVHRRAFMANLFWFLCCVLFIAGMYAVLGIGAS